MFEHKDEILLPVLDSDATAVPRYNIIGSDGKVLYKNVSLKLMNGIAQEGTPINKPLLDEFLAAAGVTAGTATAYTLAQKGYSLFDGAEVRFRLHTASGSGATLNVNGTGAKPLRDAMGESMASGMPAGTWLKAIYSTATGAYTISGSGGATSNENLIDNWYFGDPVNSRGLTEYTAAGYGIDRWKNLSSRGTVIVQNGSVKMARAGTSGYCRVNQIFTTEIARSLAGKVVTFSVLIKGNYRLYLHNAENQSGILGYKSSNAPDWDVISSTVTIPDGSTYLRFELGNNGNGDGEFIAVKLELGTRQTLARKDANGAWILNDPPPDKGMELLKCIQSTADSADTYANKIIATTDYAVNKAGDTMDGNLAINKTWANLSLIDTTSGRRGVIEMHTDDGDISLCSRKDSSNYSKFRIFPETTGINSVLGLIVRKDGVANTYNILHTGNIANYLPADTGSAKILTNTRLAENTASVAITLPAEYSYFRIVLSTITATAGGTTVSVDCPAATKTRHEGIWLFDVMLENEPGVAGFAPQSYNRLVDVQIPDVGDMASITMDVHRTADGLQGQAIAVTNGSASDGEGEIVIGSWYADGSDLTEITVSASPGSMRAGTRIMVMGVK